MDSIRAVAGEYVVGEGGRLELSSDFVLLARPYDYGDAAVDSLVACLRDEREGNFRLNGRKLPVAMSCYEALTRTAYPVEFEDGDGDWPGALKPDATSEEIRAAAAAWEVVANQKKYRRA